MPGPGYAFFGDEERANVQQVLNTWSRTTAAHSYPLGDLTQTRLFEEEAARRLASPYCLSVNSGTSALLTALAALDIGPGDEVIVPGYLYVASVAAIVHCGATPVVAEIDETLTLDPADVRARITPRTKALMPLHMLGAPCDMAALLGIAEEHGLLVLEDAAQACGGTYRGRPLGSFGRAGAFSLNMFKVVTACDGGFLLAADERTFQRAYGFHDHGWFPYRAEEGPGDRMLGLNLRMTELTAAVARAQLDRLDTVLARTRAQRDALAALIPPRDGVVRRPSHDPAGDCATVLVHLFEERAAAEAVAKRLGTKTLLHSPKHYYGGLPELRALAAGDTGPCPSRRPEAAWRRQDFRPGALPRTDDVLGRAVALTVGTSDTYLGADAGITVFSGPDEIAAAAERFRATADEVLG
ncbi:DegT/DnrJ/EryC1/StrS family aminotransferase [Streptomyces ochraceiscleroticus]|uniref:DegT/DnrJ/EryC1/StrS family aminotransferase n=1 Tax=Streptomyces ochraceiscleroticus TaxID=47761 RepID=A0ABW1MJ69_9ACTN|nr:DegT/DnrJ/EryC1/StrS family aminotransferase [Streptomyces ochraceiscleroticus]